MSAYARFLIERLVSRQVVLLIITALATVVFSGCVPRVGATAPDFDLTDQFGRPTRLAEFRGSSVLVTFLYTHCPDTCPLYLANILAARQAISDAGDEVPIVIVVTVDPDRDTVERLRAYADLWPVDWLFVTGTSRQLSDVWRRYGLSVEKRPLPHTSDVHHGYFVSHEGRLSIVNRDGVIVDELAGDWTSQVLVERLEDARDGRGVAVTTTLVMELDALIRKCGDFAAAQPELFVGLVLVAAVPGLTLPAWLLWTFLRSPTRPKTPLSGRTPPPGDRSKLSLTEQNR
jgi:protein SCO1